MTPGALRAHSLGDSAITIYLGTDQSPELLGRVQATAEWLRNKHFDDVRDVVPSYLGLTVFYDPLQTTYREMEVRLVEACQSIGDSQTRTEQQRSHVIQVIYDGPDLPEVAQRTGMTIQQVIDTHSAQTYRVDLLGFVPGFAYLSELAASLQLPRRDQPRPRVKGGSVAIAGTQTAVYPLDTPGGWHILGRTASVMFDPTRDEPALLRAGDTVRFQPA